jgi:transcriptional regulator with XRE-family HTH domain
MSRLGEKIKNLRLENGMSQKQLAKKLGATETFVNEVENGKKIINQNLIDRISKVLGKDINDITMSFEQEVYKDEKESTKKIEKKEVQKVWSDALGSVLKNVPVYKYDMATILSYKQLPLVDNKIEGHSQDKVIFIEIEDDEMLGFRIGKSDLAFAHITHEVENNSICLIEFENSKVVRQIKKLDNSKVLLISNKGSIKAETMEIKDIKVLARLDRLEIKL